MDNNPLVGIPINIDKKHHDIYKKLVERKVENVLDYPFATMKDLFVISACAGAKYNKFSNLESSRDIFSGETFDKDIDVPLLFVLAYQKEKDIDVLLEPKKVVEIAQCWANGGIDIIEEQVLNNPGRPLNNFVNWLMGENDL